MSSERILDLENTVRSLSDQISNAQKLLLLQNASSPSPTIAPSTPYPLLNISTGDTAWMLCSTALVLMMTIPGLSIYYGGMVNVKNVLATAMQSLSICCLISVLWLFVGYSLAFAPIDKIRNIDDMTVYPIGDASRMWLLGIDLYSYHQSASTIPEAVYCLYQLTFAIITPALILGSMADRIRYFPMLMFMGLWHIFVYCPIAHAIWHPEGFLYKLGALDFAGGNVVHISSGVAGLIGSMILGVKNGVSNEVFEPHSILLTFIGASLLWVGWFGFNGGSAFGANPRAAMACINTQIATCASAVTWMCTEWYIRKQPSVLGMISGTIAGLVAITPGCGYVDPTGAFIIGCLAGPWCFGGVQLKKYLGYDDMLDSFGVHAVGGTLGGLLTGLFARSEICGVDGSFYGRGSTASRMQFVYQMYAVGFSIGWSAVVSYAILKVLDVTVGLKSTAADDVLLERMSLGVNGAVRTSSSKVLAMNTAATITRENGIGGSRHGLSSSNHG